MPYFGLLIMSALSGGSRISQRRWQPEGGGWVLTYYLPPANVIFYTCLSVHGGGSTWAGTPWAGTPTRQVHPRAGTAPWEQCMLEDTGNKRAVRILLECILVWLNFCRKLHENKKKRKEASLALPFHLPLALGFNVRVYRLTYALPCPCVMDSSGATPADLLTAGPHRPWRCWQVKRQTSVPVCH